MHALFNYPRLTRLTAVSDRAWLKESLAEVGVPLEYAENAAATASNYMGLDWVNKLSGEEIEASPVLSFHPALWQVEKSFPEVIQGYYDMGIPAEDFAPHIRAANVERVKEAGYCVHVLSNLSKSGMYSDNFIIDTAFKMPVAVSEAAFLMDTSLWEMEEMYKSGFRDPSPFLRLGKSAFRFLARTNMDTRDLTDILACVSVFPERLWQTALDMGIAAEQAYKLDRRTLDNVRTPTDLVAAIHPELPLEYVGAMVNV